MTRLIMLVISIACLIFIVSLSRSIYSLWKKGEIVRDIQETLSIKQHEQEDLKDKLSYVQSQEYIEKAARDRLNLSREGETVVVIPDLSLSEPQTASIAALPNWQQWWKLFF